MRVRVRQQLVFFARRVLGAVSAWDRGDEPTCPRTFRLVLEPRWLGLSRLVVVQNQFRN